VALPLVNELLDGPRQRIAGKVVVERKIKDVDEVGQHSGYGNMSL